MSSGSASFLKAKPVWREGDSDPRHQVLGLTTDLPEGEALLRIACSTCFRAWVDGKMIAFGPAQSAHGHFRIDEWPLPQGRILAIEVVSYGANGYSSAMNPGFVCADIIVDGKAVKWTGVSGGGFKACDVPGRVRKITRYSFQRPWSEGYRLASGFDDWRKGAAPAVRLAEAPSGSFLPRRSSLPKLAVRQIQKWVAEGSWTPNPEAKVWKDRSVVNISPQLIGYPENELEMAPALELQKFTATHRLVQRDPSEQPVLKAGQSMTADFGTNLTGFIGVEVECQETTTLYLTFDEFLQESGRTDFLRLGCANAIRLDLTPGAYSFESAEPYTFRVLEAVCPKGSCTIKRANLRELCGPEFEAAAFACSDHRLNRIYRSAVESLRQNALDSFYDCPSRERAGWLCDSFFTARTAFLLSGSTGIEEDFLENFLLPDSVPGVPQGMLPMCYPSDHPDGVFIPQWSLWLILQLHEFPRRSGDSELVRRFEPKLTALLNWFKGYENEDGLLEKLPGWNFIEWSKANEWVQEVHYPTNMLYARVLDCFSELYGSRSARSKAARIRRKVHEQSYDGEFFVDNAVRKNGRLTPTGNRSEVAQYFAFFFGAASAEDHPELWHKLVTEFGPDRKETGRHPQIAHANAFVGNYLRLELLRRAGMHKQVCQEMVGYFTKMADATGTLWENDSPAASCCHGFASHVAVWIFHSVLGVSQDRLGAIQAELPDCGLDWAQGRLPRDKGWVSVDWSGRDYRVSLPEEVKRIQPS